MWDRTYTRVLRYFYFRRSSDLSSNPRHLTWTWAEVFTCMARGNHGGGCCKGWGTFLAFCTRWALIHMVVQITLSRFFPQHRPNYFQFNSNNSFIIKTIEKQLLMVPDFMIRTFYLQHRPIQPTPRSVNIANPMSPYPFYPQISIYRNRYFAGTLLLDVVALFLHKIEQWKLILPQGYPTTGIKWCHQIWYGMLGWCRYRYHEFEILKYLTRCYF